MLGEAHTENAVTFQSNLMRPRLPISWDRHLTRKAHTRKREFVLNYMHEQLSHHQHFIICRPYIMNPVYKASCSSSLPRKKSTRQSMSTESPALVSLHLLHQTPCPKRCYTESPMLGAAESTRLPERLFLGELSLAGPWAPGLTGRGVGACGIGNETPQLGTDHWREPNVNAGEPKPSPRRFSTRSPGRAPGAAARVPPGRERHAGGGRWVERVRISLCYLSFLK